MEQINNDLKNKVLFFDLETQQGADEVGGWGNIHLMKMSVGVVYNKQDNKFYTFLENDIDSLIDMLISADLVVGFNIVGFDYKVLQPYTEKHLKEIKTFDMLSDIYKKLGYRLSLNHLAQKTLNAGKSADGLQALKWFKEGNMEDIIHYCKKDVEITRDLFMFGAEKKHVLFEKRGLGVVELPVKWDVENIKT